MTTNVESIPTSLPVQSSTGNLVLPSGQGVVVRSSTKDGKPSSDIIIKCLCAMLQRLLFESPSRDVVSLAFGSAETEMVERQHISQADWDYVQEVVLKQYEVQRRRNPMSGMF